MSTTSIRKRYPSNLIDHQWANIEDLVPEGDGRTGRPRSYPLPGASTPFSTWPRGAVPGGCGPIDFRPGRPSPTISTLGEKGVWEQVHATLRDEIRAAAGKEPNPNLAIIDSQSVTSTEAGGPKGYDGGKKIAGRKRHLLVDILGLVWGLAVLAAAPTDWDGAVEVFRRIGQRMPRLAKVLADHAYRALVSPGGVDQGALPLAVGDIGEASRSGPVRAGEMALDWGADVWLVRTLSSAVEGLRTQSAEQ